MAIGWTDNSYSATEAMRHALLIEGLLARGKLVRPFEISNQAVDPYLLVHPQRYAHLSFGTAFETWIKDQILISTQMGG